MNITDFHVTPMEQVYASVERLARAHGATLAGGELIGLIPEDAYEPGAEWVAAIADFDPEAKVLERKLHSPIEWPEG